MKPNQIDPISLAPLTSVQLLTGDVREFMLLAGKDGVGKTSAIISLAVMVERVLNPGARFFVIDTENKVKAALKGLGDDVPHNLTYYKAETMNQATEALAAIMDAHKPGDWLAIESMARLWERAQDMGYMAIKQLTKAAYLERRKTVLGPNGSKLPVTPQPDELWSVIKGAHDGAFLDVLSQSETLNVVLSTTVQRPPKPDSSFRKENQDRKDIRNELGLDVGLDGAPRLPTYVQTLGLFELKDGNVVFRILRDNLSSREDPRVTIEVPGKKMWAMSFWMNCRA